MPEHKPSDFQNTAGELPIVGFVKWLVNDIKASFEMGETVIRSDNPSPNSVSRSIQAQSEPVPTGGRSDNDAYEQPWLAVAANWLVRDIKGSLGVGEAKATTPGGEKIDAPRPSIWIDVRKILAISVVSGLLLLVFAIRPALDYYTLKHVSPDISALADAGGLNRNGLLYLARTHPLIQQNSDFKIACPSSDTRYIEQGCYYPSRSQIYLRTMPSDLHSVETVTAAHEMLHAVYHGLSSNERSRIDTLLEANYTANFDSDLDKRMVSYSVSEPGARDAELHSILGTEMPVLSPELEQYYSKFFTDRQAVVTANRSVTSLFSSYQSQLTSLNTKITNEKQEAENLYSWHIYYGRLGDEYNWNLYYSRYRNAFTGIRSDISAYNAQIDSYDLLIAEFNGQELSSLPDININTQ